MSRGLKLLYVTDKNAGLGNPDTGLGIFVGQEELDLMIREGYKTVIPGRFSISYLRRKFPLYYESFKVVSVNDIELLSGDEKVWVLDVCDELVERLESIGVSSIKVEAVDKEYFSTVYLSGFNTPAINRF